MDRFDEKPVVADRDPDVIRIAALFAESEKLQEQLGDEVNQERDSFGEQLRAAAKGWITGRRAAACN